MSIEAFPVLHCGSTKDSGILAPVPAMGYRISYKDETVAISGDTGNCPSLKRLVGGADLAILEATYRSRSDVGEEYLQKVHLSRDLATKLGGTAKEFILVHKGRRKE
jgi:ribonuclease BN (tRNA processing enzyme)